MTYVSRYRDVCLLIKDPFGKIKKDTKIVFWEWLCFQYFVGLANVKTSMGLIKLVYPKVISFSTKYQRNYGCTQGMKILVGNNIYVKKKL